MHASNLYFSPLVGASFDRLSNTMEALTEGEENVVPPPTPGTQPSAQTE